MSLALVTPFRKDIEEWKEAINALDPDIEVFIYPEIPHSKQVLAALLWNHPENIFTQFPHLRWVSSLGAGVDHIISDQHLPDDVVVTRIVDDELAIEMTRYLVMAVLSYQKNLFRYINAQAQKKWAPHPARKNLKIGVLGLGFLGSHVAKALSQLSFDVLGYAASEKKLKGVTTFHGEQQLPDFLTHLDVLINLLPLTPKTNGILGMNLFQKFTRPVYLINVARGAHVVENDLLAALENRQLSGAMLDVFDVEPLPDNHPFWTHPNITVTPHVASWTNPVAAVTQLVENYRRMRSGQKLLNEIQRNREY
ncbi:glyoxylate/hydroxypyruvate reductase A [Fulvivirgaceae bacterium BMA12]|uniref:Glyoxylate/hydroxypyruvate reductase A n=1 Tax=Agaribacillus aureus TaxID=3051825 RepID=A0ABT8LA32_9BACT|nr:glyoxylate/hydroxypyruvate reductase A [Fulvivirgaceae bacterium BMA12]